MLERIENHNAEEMSYLSFNDLYKVKLSDINGLELSEFDRRVRLMTILNDKSRFCWLSIDDELIFFGDHFPKTHLHICMTFANFRRITPDRRLQAAGFIDIKTAEDGSATRRLYGFPESLERFLSEEESKRYKNGVLRQKLGEDFRIE